MERSGTVFQFLFLACFILLHVLGCSSILEAMDSFRWKEPLLANIKGALKRRATSSLPHSDGLQQLLRRHPR